MCEPIEEGNEFECADCVTLVEAEEWHLNNPPFHEEQNLATQSLVSKVRDLDYAEAVSRLSFQSFVLEAAQQSFVRVSRLSLFNAL